MKCDLIKLFKSCLNILRDNEGLTGEKALRNMSYFLTLKLIEPRIGHEINLDNYDYDFSHIDGDIAKHKSGLLHIARFSNLLNEHELDIPVNLRYLWEDILSVHPSTCNIFLPGKTFDIERQDTYRKLLNKLNELDLSNTDYDILGNSYEEVIQDIMTGKVLGQFFTQPCIKKMMVKLINPQLMDDGTIESCADPTMGTGGFLISCIRHIIDQSKSRNIKPDWEYIKNHGIYGKELEPDTYQLAVSNLLISSGHLFDKLDRGDSIREPITRKFDCILANPPFGIKGLKYDGFNYPLKSEYIPIKTDSAVSLFIQAIIHMLNINGRCAVVLPDGQDLFGKNKKLMLIREYLLRTCDLQRVIYLPIGIFNYTNIKTCVFYFIKKTEGREIINCSVSVSKTTGKESRRVYKFTGTPATKLVSYCSYNPEDESMTPIIQVNIDQIISNNYSLNGYEYIHEEEVDRPSDVNVVMLGDICTFLAKSKRKASHGNASGKYPFYTSSQICSKYCDVPDYTDECLIIGTGGNANIKYSSRFSCSADNIVMTIHGAETKYVYYYLYNNIHILEKGFVGTGLKHISKDYVKKIKIPIPPLDRQIEVIQYIEKTENINNSLAKKIERNKSLAKSFIESSINCS